MSVSFRYTCLAANGCARHIRIEYNVIPARIRTRESPAEDAELVVMKLHAPCGHDQPGEVIDQACWENFHTPER